jgi:LPS-assembly lipoprotein
MWSSSVRSGRAEPAGSASFPGKRKSLRRLDEIPARAGTTAPRHGVDPAAKCPSRRAAIAGLGVLLLGGCFRPMLAETGAASELRHRIALPPVDGRFDYYLVQSLEDRLGEPQDPQFVLDVTPIINERGLAVTRDNAVTRITLLVRAPWSLSRPGAAQPLLSDVAISESGYNATSSLFGTRQARLEIERRLAKDIGERIARRILARADELAA